MKNGIADNQVNEYQKKAKFLWNIFAKIPKVLFFLLIFWALFIPTGKAFYVPLPWKITDPEDASFDPYRFRFEDYNRPYGLSMSYGYCPIIKKIIKPGMLQSEVSKIMDNARARARERDGYVLYVNPIFIYGIWKIIFFTKYPFVIETYAVRHDQNGIVTKLTCKTEGGGGVYAKSAKIKAYGK